MTPYLLVYYSLRIRCQRLYPLRPAAPGAGVTFRLPTRCSDLPSSHPSLCFLALLHPTSYNRCRGTDGKFPLLSLWIFDPDVGKLPEILVERGDGSVFGSGRSGDYAINEMNFRPSIAV